MRRRARHVDAHHQDALRLDADEHVRRLAADDEVGTESVAHHHLRTVLPRLRTFLVRDHHQLQLRAVEPGLREVGDRQHHRPEGRLHVVGAAPVQPAAVDARRELLLVPGHHVQVAVEDEPRLPRPDAGDQRPAPAGLHGLHVRAARLEPAGDEVGRLARDRSGARCHRRSAARPAGPRPPGAGYPSLVDGPSGPGAATVRWVIVSALVAALLLVPGARPPRRSGRWRSRPRAASRWPARCWCRRGARPSRAPCSWTASGPRTASGGGGAYRRARQALARRGVAVLRYDKRGIGASEGPRAVVARRTAARGGRGGGGAAARGASRASTPVA